MILAKRHPLHPRNVLDIPLAQDSRTGSVAPINTGDTTKENKMPVSGETLQPSNIGSSPHGTGYWAIPVMRSNRTFARVEVLASSAAAAAMKARELLDDDEMLVPL